METMFMQVFEHRDSVEAQMRQQVASFSDSLACTLLAAGSRPPAWLFPQFSSAIGAQGNTLRKLSLDLGNLRTEDDVHLAPPTSHQVSEPKPLEFDGVKPGSCNIIGSSEKINQSKSCMSQTILIKCTSAKLLNEDLSSTISLEASLHEVVHSVSSPLPEKETTHAAENYSLEGPSSMASQLLENDSLQSVKPNFLEGIDSAPGSMPEKDTIHTAQIDFLERPTSGAPEILGSLEKNMLDDDCGRSPYPKKNIVEDGCRHDSHSHVCGVFNTCSSQSSANLEKLLPKSANNEHLYQNNILFPGTIIHNDCCSASASDAFISARSEPLQMQTSLPELSPEFDRTAATEDTHIEFSSLSTSNKSLQIEPVLDSVTCHLQQSGHAESKLLVRSEADVSVRNNMDECVTPAVTGGASSEGAQILQTAERNSTPSVKGCLGSLWHEELNARSSTAVYDKQIQSSQTSAQHLPRSSGSGKMVASFKSDVQSTVSHLNRSYGVQTQVDSSCEVLMNCQSSCNASLVPQYSQSHYLENNLDKASNSLPTYSNTLSDGDACYISKKISCFANPDTDVKVVTVEDKILAGRDCDACGSGVLNTEKYLITSSPTTLPRYALYQKNQHASPEFDEKGIDDGQQVSNGAIPCQNVDTYADNDETEQPCQSFSIPIPSKTKSSTVKERVFVGLCESAKLIDLSCNLSRKYKMDSKMKPLCGVYESLAAKFEKLVNRCSIDSVDTRWHDTSYDINNLGVPGKYSLEFDDSLLMSNVLTYDLANANSVQEDSYIPLTPSVQKYSLEKLSRKTGSNSECMGSIPELACFQIHEDSNIAEENENEEMLPGCPGTNYSTQDLTDRKPLDHVTSSYQSREKKTSLSTRYVDVGRPGLITSKSYSMDPDRHLHIRTDQAMKNPKEKRTSSIRKGKVSQPFHYRESRAELLNRKNARHRSEANLGKGWKPSKTVTNMTPSVPLVKQNHQFRTGCVKKDIRVKALEAAEATKRRQENKQNERETRKVAARLECERLKQAREQQQKLAKQKNKMDTDVTRKRQRGDAENKEKGRKKNCTEGAQIPEQLVDQMHATNIKKDGCLKNYDDKEPRKDLVGGLKHKLVPGERTESVHTFIASESNDLQAVSADGTSEISTLQVQQIFSDDVNKSYEMSPCKDSDEEDTDDFEHQEELRRRRKLIPSWSREENLDKILLSNQSLDPAEIFARKGCFILSDVLALRVPQRLFN